jgi:hypothetical protein
MKHGGRREGAGRPFRDGVRRVSITIRVLPRTAERLRAVAKFNEVSQGQCLDMILKLEKP